MSPWRKRTCLLGASGHVSLAQADMSPWRKQTCHLEASRHVTLKQADMSLWSKQTCLFWRNGHVPLDTSTLKGINFGLQPRFVVSLAGLTTASRYITAECITPKSRFYENPPCAVKWILAFQRCSADWATDPRNIKIT